MGRARLATNSSPIVVVACSAARAAGVFRRDDEIKFEPDQFARQPGEPLHPPVCGSVLDDDVLALDLSDLAQALPEGVDFSRGPGRSIEQVPDTGDVTGRLRMGNARRG